MTPETGQAYDGVIDNVIYHNKENGYTVFVMISDAEKDEQITCVAHLPNPSEGESIKVEGSFVVHPTYGRQLNVERYEKILPTSSKGIEKYLGSGAVKGIRERLAKKIVNRFGKNTLTVIEEQPERLTEIPGINMEKAMTISATIHEQAALRRVMIFLQEYSIPPSYAMKIHKKYKDATIDMVKSNPYKLAEDIRGIGFKTADSIAYRLGMEENSPYRVRAGIKYCLSQASLNGHVYLPQGKLTDSAAELLNLPLELVENSFVDMQINKEITREQLDSDIGVYLNYFYFAENSVAKRIIELCSFSFEAKNNADGESEKPGGITLAESQKLAVEEAMRSGVTVITGGPGTGKTTTINALINTAGLKSKIELAAPTGRAAKRMSEATGREARTLHRLLEISFLDDDNPLQSFGKNEDNPIEADIVIVDESSMVDILLMYNLLKAVTPGTRLVLVGDVDQLPSVGPGNVLKDIINSGYANVVRLTEIFRQAGESAIVMNAHRINNGLYPVLNEKNKDFFFVRRGAADEVVSTVLDLVMNRLPSFKKCNKINDIQVLSPMRKSLIGVENLNRVLQEALNPAGKGKKERALRFNVFREGDKIMQIKNNYNLSWKILDKRGQRVDEGLGVFNGDMGIIKTINEEDEYLTVIFDDERLVEYDFTLLDELELAYATTIHKSQGSEYRVVVIPIHSGPHMLMSRNLLYTGITRAKELAVIVGLPETLNRMVDNNLPVHRYSSLSERIKRFGKLFE